MRAMGDFGSHKGLWEKKGEVNFDWSACLVEKSGEKEV